MCYNKPHRQVRPPLGGRMRGEMKRQQDEFFTEIYNKTYNSLSKFVSRRTKDTGMTEDILQEVYLEAFRHLDDLKTHENPVGWIYKTAYNKIKKMNSIYDRHAFYETGLEEGMDREVWDNSDLVELEEYRAALREDEYELLIKKYVEGYSHKDLAQMTGGSVAGNKMKLSRIVSKLKKICRVLLLFARF